MQFLKTLFWVALAAVLVLFASVNWQQQGTINLWGGLQVDIKLPILILFSFLLGLVPMFALHRARLWTLRRRLDAHERQAAAASAPYAHPEPIESRAATDSAAWPAA